MSKINVILEHKSLYDICGRKLGVELTAVFASPDYELTYRRFKELPNEWEQGAEHWHEIQMIEVTDAG
jgi:hypothetical protein